MHDNRESMRNNRAVFFGRGISNLPVVHSA
jgi:hypothetical protein